MFAMAAFDGKRFVLWSITLICKATEGVALDACIAAPFVRDGYEVDAMMMMKHHHGVTLPCVALVQLPADQYRTHSPVL